MTTNCGTWVAVGFGCSCIRTALQVEELHVTVVLGTGNRPTAASEISRCDRMGWGADFVRLAIPRPVSAVLVPFRREAEFKL